MDAEGLGRKLLLTLSADSRRTPEKQTLGTVTASQQKKANPASSFELSQCWRCKRGWGGGGICVKRVPFVKLAFSLGNRAHFGSKMGLFSAFSYYVFNDCGPNRGFHSDFALSPILTL